MTTGALCSWGPSPSSSCSRHFNSNGKEINRASGTIWRETLRAEIHPFTRVTLKSLRCRNHSWVLLTRELLSFWERIPPLGQSLWNTHWTKPSFLKINTTIQRIILLLRALEMSRHHTRVHLGLRLVCWHQSYTLLRTISPSGHEETSCLHKRAHLPPMSTLALLAAPWDREEERQSVVVFSWWDF